MTLVETTKPPAEPGPEAEDEWEQFYSDLGNPVG